MTLAEQIKAKVDKLEPVQQRSVLKLLNAMQNSPKKCADRRGKARKSEISAAVRGIAGIWKDREDLPRNSVEAVKALRSRMWSRGKNG